MATPKVRMKISGNKPDLEVLLGLLEEKYELIPTSEYLVDSGNHEQFYRYVTVIRRTQT